MAFDQAQGNAAGSGSDLPDRIRLGSAEALSEAYRIYGTRIFQLAYRITGNRADAEDILQDVFLGLPLALGRYRDQGRFGPWLGRVAARVVRTRTAPAQMHRLKWCGFSCRCHAQAVLERRPARTASCTN